LNQNFSPDKLYISFRYPVPNIIKILSTVFGYKCEKTTCIVFLHFVQNIHEGAFSIKVTCILVCCALLIHTFCHVAIPNYIHYK